MQFTYQIEKPYEHLLQVFQDMAFQVGLVEEEPIIILPSKPEYAYRMKIRKEQADCFDPNNWDKIYKMHAWLELLTPMNYAMFHGQKLLLLASILPVAEKVGEISFLTDSYLPTSSLKVRRKAVLLFKKMLLELPFPRLQAKVSSLFEQGQAFVEKLGFEREGVLRRFGPSQIDYIMYGLLKE